ncbi:MAG TPA: ubiquinone/menaquinone biosynthesis methyltransferase [Vicinamibacterales bacterium]|nr:ubiquinone/menaquinone biosynthesis methyltransferase [Vicinamibacterales bacterium]
MSLREAVSTPEGKRTYVRRLFATIADRYDLITVVLSYGQDRAWKRRLVRMAGPRRGARVLDLATGTGDIGYLLHDAGAHVVGLDLTLRMIQLARAKRANRARPAFLAGDMSALPFAPATFDLVTTGYGLRNVPDLALSLREIARVLKPGGQLLSLDFDRPASGLVRTAYLAYLSLVGGALGWILHRDPDTYRYIPASIRNYPGAAGVVILMQANGFVRASRHRVLGGLMAIHDART